MSKKKLTCRAAHRKTDNKTNRDPKLTDHTDLVCWMHSCLFELCVQTFDSMTGPFMCHSGNTGVEWTPNKSQHRKLILEKKILLLLLPSIEPATF